MGENKFELLLLLCTERTKGKLLDMHNFVESGISKARVNVKLLRYIRSQGFQSSEVRVMRLS